MKCTAQRLYLVRGGAGFLGLNTSGINKVCITPLNLPFLAGAVEATDLLFSYSHEGVNKKGRSRMGRGEEGDGNVSRSSVMRGWVAGGGHLAGEGRGCTVMGRRR